MEEKFKRGWCLYNNENLLDLLNKNKNNNPNPNEINTELDSIVAGDGIDISSNKHNGKITVKAKKSFIQRVKDYIPSFEFGTKEVFDSKPYSISTYGFIYFSIKNKFYNFQISLTESRSNGWFLPKLDYKIIKM